MKAATKPTTTQPTTGAGRPNTANQKPRVGAAAKTGGVKNADVELLEK